MAPEKSENDSPGKGPVVTLDDAPKEQITHFEDIIEKLGSFGHWQRVIFVLISLGDIFGAMCMLIPVFIGATPSWRCARYENENETLWTEADGPFENFSDWKTCERNETKCIQFQFVDDFTSIISQWSLVCDYKYLSDMISSIQMGGVFLGAAVFGQLSDTYGRKRTYFISFGLLIVSGMLSAASVNWQMYAVCRFLVGAGFGAYMVINCVYPLEFVGNQWRILCGTIGFWAIGIMLLAGIGYLLRDWRYLTAGTTTSGILFFLTWWIIPESPRWLVQQRRFGDAQEILDKIADKNKKPRTTEEVLKTFAVMDEEERERLKKYTYLDLFRRWEYTKRTLVVALIWFTAFLVYYEISFNLKHLSGNRYLNMFFGGFVDLAAMMIVLLLLNRIGRKISLVIFLGISFLTLISILIIITTGKEKQMATVILVLSLCGKANSLAGTYNVQIMTAELFPTVIRNVGMGAGAIAGRLGGMLAPALVYLGQVEKLAPYIICSILAAISIPPLFLVPETTGQPLEDSYDPRAKPQEQPEQNGDNINRDETVTNSTRV